MSEPKSDKPKRYIEESWQLCLKGLPIVMSPESLRTFRAIFFAGAASCFSLTAKMDAVGIESYEEFAEFMNALEAELQHFVSVEARILRDMARALDPNNEKVN